MPTQARGFQRVGSTPGDAEGERRVRPVLRLAPEPKAHRGYTPEGRTPARSCHVQESPSALGQRGVGSRPRSGLRTRHGVDRRSRSRWNCSGGREFCPRRPRSRRAASTGVPTDCADAHAEERTPGCTLRDVLPAAYPARRHIPPTGSSVVIPSASQNSPSDGTTRGSSAVIGRFVRAADEDATFGCIPPRDETRRGSFQSRDAGRERGPRRYRPRVSGDRGKK